MSSKSKHTFTGSQAEDKLSTPPLSGGVTPVENVYPHLLHLMNLIAQTSPAADVIAPVAAYLRDHCRCRSLHLQTRPSEIDSAAPQITILFPQSDTPAALTFVFEPGADPLPRELLEALTACLAMRLADQQATLRALRAEQTAALAHAQLAAQYDLNHALAPDPAHSPLQRIVERAARLLQAQACSLLLLDPDTSRLHVAASHGLPPDVRAQTQLLGHGLAGRVAQSRQPLLISPSQPPDPRLHDLALRPGHGSAMLVPLHDAQGQVLGVLCLRRRPDRPEFTQAEAQLFTDYAAHAALALLNARLLEDHDRRAATLHKLATLSHALLSTTDLDALLQRILAEIVAVAGVSRCCLYLRDPVRPLYIPRAALHYPESLTRNPVKFGEGVIGHVARVGSLLHYDGRRSEEDALPSSPTARQMKGFARALGTDAYVAIPLLTGQNDCIGVLLADNKMAKTPLAAEQTHLLHAFVSQAAIAIENALLYERMQESAASQRRLHAYTDNVLQSIESAILTTDSRSRIVRCNRAAEEMFQTRARRLRDIPLGEAFAALRLPTEESQAIVDVVRQVQETGERVHRHKLTLHPHERPAVTLYLMISRLPEPRPVRPGVHEPQGVVLIFEDVTQEVRLEAELEKMRRLADIGQLAAKMAHEVRNALSPIKGAAQIIRSEIEREEEAGRRGKEAEGRRQKAEEPASDLSFLLPPSSFSTEWPDMIIAEVDGLNRLTGEMLDFARPMPPRLRPLDINAFLRTAVLALTPFLEEHRVRLEWKLEPALPDLEADAVQMGQVVRNVVMNAAQSMPEGGRLIVQTERLEQSGSLALRFHDQGTGIPAEDRERIFRPFVTTRPKGTGLGLPIVQKIVEQHAGRVEVQSEPGEGTIFTIWLPLGYRETDAGLPSPDVLSPDQPRPEPPLIYDRTAGEYPAS